MAMGPMALGDLVGQELFWKQRKVRKKHVDVKWCKVGPWDPEKNRGERTPVEVGEITPQANPVFFFGHLKLVKV